MPQSERDATTHDWKPGDLAKLTTCVSGHIPEADGASKFTIVWAEAGTIVEVLGVTA